MYERNCRVWSIRFDRICFAGLSGCWGTLSARGLMRGIVFVAQQPPDLTALATSAIATVLVAAIGIAVGDADGGAEGIQLDCPSVRHWDVVGTSS